MVWREVTGLFACTCAGPYPTASAHMAMPPPTHPPTTPPTTTTTHTHTHTSLRALQASHCTPAQAS